MEESQARPGAGQAQANGVMKQTSAVDATRRELRAASIDTAKPNEANPSDGTCSKVDPAALAGKRAVHTVIYVRHAVAFLAPWGSSCSSELLPLAWPAPKFRPYHADVTHTSPPPSLHMDAASVHMQIVHNCSATVRRRDWTGTRCDTRIDPAQETGHSAVLSPSWAKQGWQDRTGSGRLDWVGVVVAQGRRRNKIVRQERHSYIQRTSSWQLMMRSRSWAVHLGSLGFPWALLQLGCWRRDDRGREEV